jgi:4-amino-4-deoxy-L-arabinose transferase-like glycosyltransferase
MAEDSINMRTWEWLLLLLCLTIFGVQAVSSNQLKSATFDEEYHITRGYAYLRTGDFRLSFSHPPLVNLWTSLPLLWLPDINLPTEHPSWEESNLLDFADEFLWRSNENPQQIVTLARLPITILGILLVFVMFWWTRQLAGLPASLAVLFLAIFDPNLLAHSRFATNDLGLTCFLLVTTWRLWCWLEKPSLLNALLVGLFAGATMTTKFSGLMVWPIIFFIVLLYPGYTRRRLLELAGMGLVALGVLWVVYSFDFGPLPGIDWAIPMPAPYYFSSLRNTFVDFEAVPRPAFLFGQVSDHGWWYYFPIALIVKNSIPTLILSVLGAVALLRLDGPRRASVLWLPFLFFLGLGMTGRLSIGFRHILPGIPFLLIIASHSVLWANLGGAKTARLAMPVVGVLILWQAIGTVKLFPHYEAYFNELAGGSDNGYRVLVDSNLDWGQDLPALKQLMDDQGLEQVYLSYFGTAPPEKYGVDYHPLPSFPRFVKGKEEKAYNPYTPPPGWYAISATSLQLGLYLENRDLFAYFRNKEPDRQAGYSINLYEVQYPNDTTIKRDAIIDQAVWEIPVEQFDLHPNERLITKWTQSSNTSITWPTQEEMFPPGMQPVGANFNNAFVLLGFDLKQPEVKAGENFAITLVWQVKTADVAMPSPTMADPLAAFIHLSSADDSGEIVAQYDGWETALTGLENGDIITQFVEVQVPEDTAPATYLLRAGLYSPQSWQRLPTTWAGEETDRITLAPVTVVAEDE